MTTHTIILPSNTSSYYEKLDDVNVDDRFILTLDFSFITEIILPVNMLINWGDGVIQNFDGVNVDSNDINIFKVSPLLVNHSHIYNPSETSLYKCLSAQVLINYCNGDYTWFIIPITIRTYDYFESIGDVTLKNTNILLDNKKEHQLLISKGGYTIELVG